MARPRGQQVRELCSARAVRLGLGEAGRRRPAARRAADRVRRPEVELVPGHRLQAARDGPAPAAGTSHGLRPAACSRRASAAGSRARGGEGVVLGLQAQHVRLQVVTCCRSRRFSAVSWATTRGSVCAHVAEERLGHMVILRRVREVVARHGRLVAAGGEGVRLQGPTPPDRSIPAGYVARDPPSRSPAAALCSWHAPGPARRGAVRLRRLRQRVGALGAVDPVDYRHVPAGRRRATRGRG